MANYHAFTCFLRALAIKAASRKKLKTGQLYMLAHEIGDGARRAGKKLWAKIKLIISQLEGIKCSLGAVCLYELKATQRQSTEGAKRRWRILARENRRPSTKFSRQIMKFERGVCACVLTVMMRYCVKTC
jgi:hypothetical protein